MEMHADKQEHKPRATKLPRLKWIKCCNEDERGKDESKEHTPSLVGYKAGFFMICAALSVTASFLPLYFKQIGLSPFEVGIAMFCRQFGGFVGGVIAPYLVAIMPRNSHCYVFPGLFLVFTMALNFSPQLPLRTDCPENMLNRTQNIDLNVTHKEHKIVQADFTLMFEPSDGVSLMVFVCVFGFCGEIFGLATDAIQHGATMRSLKHDTAAYGPVRAWAALGFAAACIATGVVVNFSVRETVICSNLSSIADYHSVFYVFAFFAVGTTLNAVNFEQPENGLYGDDNKKLMPGKDFRRALGTTRNLAWLTVVLLRSVFYGVSQGILKWHMENIGASPALIGLSGGITTVTEFVVFFWTPELIKRFGHVTLVNVGIVSYAVRFIVFSLITNPVYVLPIEFLEGAMFSCIWASIVAHLSSQVPEVGQNQIQGLIQALLMMGMATGFLVSGGLTQIFGAPVMFRIFSGMAALTWLMFFLAQTLPDKSLIA